MLTASAPSTVNFFDDNGKLASIGRRSELICFYNTYRDSISVAPETVQNPDEDVPVCPAPNPAVDHPSHYGGADNAYEAIKVIEAWELGFHLGNTLKYIKRDGKGDYIQDLEKARWYLDRKISILKALNVKVLPQSMTSNIPLGVMSRDIAGQYRIMQHDGTEWIMPPDHQGYWFQIAKDA